MSRVAGIDLPLQKRIEVGLTYIYGIGPSLSKKVLAKSGVSPDTRVKNLTEADLAAIRKAVADLEIQVEGELKRVVSQNVRRLQEIKSYRGLRHRAGLPVRGQNTSRNSRTRKGKKRTVGGLKKKLTKK